MKITDTIELIKKYHVGDRENPIKEETTRDKILYGNPDVECTGIVTTCFASVDVIKKAHEMGANLIISHEALFWNHGDHTDWLKDNKTFIAKKKLLDETGIVVWRDHDYIHYGIPLNGSYVDGIFYGVAAMLGFENYLTDKVKCTSFEIPPMKVKDLASLIIDKFHLNGVRALGDMEAEAKKVRIPFHIIGNNDNEILQNTEDDDIDVLLTMELTDFTVNEYIRDSAMVNRHKAILAIGHFNLEEPGMEYMPVYLNKLVNVPVKFIQSGDANNFITK